MGEGSLNNKIEVAWMEARKAQPLAGRDKREFQTRFIHYTADHLGTSLDRVRERVIKIERRESKPIVIDRDLLDRVVDDPTPAVRATLVDLGLGRYLSQETS
jgi:hypothetical protein